jgi:carboxypeptidase family protein
MRSIKTLLRFAALAGCAALIAAGETAGGDKKKSNDPDTVIAGTVFRDPGYALPEATVTLVRRDDPKHKKLAEMTTSFRGEFVIHVPATPSVYVVKASAKGFRPEEKEASITGLDRVDLMFTLEPEKKK